MVSTLEFYHPVIFMKHTSKKQIIYLCTYVRMHIHTTTYMHTKIATYLSMALLKMVLKSTKFKYIKFLYQFKQYSLYLLHVIILCLVIL